ncbi:MAG TPA: SPOR domain-containing protein [Bacillota bacterium]|nr:SPOR domain-containing protein [Bacillota bacterium]
MRYSRIRKQNARKKYAFLIVVVILISCIIYIIFAGTLGKLLSGVISPIVGKNSEIDSQGRTEDNPTLTLPDNGNEEKITDTIIANTISLYSIQMGAFIDMKNAEDYSYTNKSLGGAGFITEDTYYRVLAVGFKSENDAISVKEQLEEDDIDSQVYSITSPGITLQITASQSNVDAIKSAFAIWEENYYLLEDILKRLDRSQIDALAAQNEIRTIEQLLNNKKSTLENIGKGQDDNPILAGLLQLYKDTVDSLETIISENPSTKVAISSKIKYTYIELMTKYKGYLEQIKG